MTPRQNAILRRTIREHIRTGLPVGSETVLECTRLPLSSATVRMELAVLEDQGYLSHPHTSAGRVPTTAGYRYYVDHWVARSPHPRAFEQLERIEHATPDMRESSLARSLAQMLARVSGTLAVVALHEQSVHEAGFGQLVRMRDLGEDSAVSDVERILNIIEEQPSAMPALTENVVVFINGEIPFTRARRVSIVATESALPSGQPLLAALIGPIRMPYDRHVAVLEALHRAFADHAQS